MTSHSNSSGIVSMLFLGIHAECTCNVNFNEITIVCLSVDMGLSHIQNAVSDLVNQVAQSAVHNAGT